MHGSISIANIKQSMFRGLIYGLIFSAIAVTFFKIPAGMPKLIAYTLPISMAIVWGIGALVADSLKKIEAVRKVLESKEKALKDKEKPKQILERINIWVDRVFYTVCVLFFLLILFFPPK